VIDDGSTDKTHEIVSKFEKATYIHQENAGKGSAVQHGISQATGDFILIQDADLEYDVNDYEPLMETLYKGLKKSEKIAVYGSRTLKDMGSGGECYRYRRRPLTGQTIGPWLANVLLSAVVAGLYGKWVSDTLTGYKIYPCEFFTNNKITSLGFEADHEITAKLIKQGFEIIEVPVSYLPRSIEEGKKIRPIDGVVAVKVYVQERFRP
jgi:glycosyltransferase involved in cell wall biosynthesis